MKYLLFVVLGGLIFSCQVTPKEEQTEDGLDLKDVRVIDPDAAVAGCYTAVLKRDTANIVVQQTEDEKSVNADLEYRNFEKDGSKGTFNGTLSDSLLIGYYKFFSEGQSSVAQTVFKVKGDTLYQGYGDIAQRGDTVVFKDVNALQYMTEKPFIKRDCD